MNWTDSCLCPVEDFCYEADGYTAVLLLIKHRHLKYYIAKTFAEKRLCKFLISFIFL